MTEKITLPELLLQADVLDHDAFKKLQDKELTLEDMVSAGQLNKFTYESYKSAWENTPYLDKIDIPDTIPDLLNLDMASRHHALVAEESDNDYKLVVADPLDDELLDYLDFKSDKELLLYVADKNLIDMLISRLYRRTQDIVDRAEQLDTMGHGLVGGSGALSNPLADFVEMILEDAIQFGATDIHFEQKEGVLQYFYRVGHDTTIATDLPPNIASILLQRIVLMGNGDITESKKPQDLHYTHQSKFEGRAVDLRISVVYTAGGYSVVIRLLKRDQKTLSMEMILNGETLSVVEKFLQLKHGLMLVTGPTASGKTTLLYSVLEELSKGSKKILTIEDPVEISYSYLNQTQVEPDLGLDFGDVIRSSLRQNPDVLMVGEIRDVNSAQMTFRAALTGAQTLSTLHTESAYKTIVRLLDLEVESFYIATALRLVLAVRLLRKNCEFCMERKDITSSERERIEDYVGAKSNELSHLYFGPGCNVCDQSGKFGQTLIAEYLVIDEDISLAISSNDIERIYTEVDSKMKERYLIDDAFRLLQEGVVPLDEFISAGSQL